MASAGGGGGWIKNLKTARQQVDTVVGTNSCFVKFLCIGVCIGYCLSFSERATFSLCVLPGNVLPPNFWIWTCLTHNFVEVHCWVLLCDVAVVFLYGKLLEPLWGTMEMIIFFVIVNLSVAVLTTGTYLFLYLLTQDTDFLFDNYIHGMAGYLAGFAIAVKQAMPDHVLVSSPFGKLRNLHIPLLLLVAAIVARVAGAVDPPFPIMFGWGLFTSWVYLRFYQRHSSGSRGDMADNFALASFFPSRVRPFVAVIANVVFALLVRLHVCRTPQRKYDISAPTTITVTLPGASAQEVERRRLLAIKALNDRLTTSPAASSGWPSMVDGASGSATEHLAGPPSDGLSSATGQPASSLPPQQVPLAKPADTGSSSPDDAVNKSTAAANTL